MSWFANRGGVGGEYRCENLYTITIHSEDEITLIGVPNCRGCGGGESVAFEDLDKDFIQTDE